MIDSAQDLLIDTPEDLIPRREALRSFFGLLPLEEFTLGSSRVVNLWGATGVGKTTFLNSLRESEFMARKKIVWITPKADPSIDTPQEFIAACSQGVRFPQNPEMEESISERLDESQKGKVDPIHSDDSLLITCSTIAGNKKPYVNAAAAASVGRTNFIREDMEVSVGLGNNRAGNQAEAFLDALPLQSMGADLVLLHLENEDTLSGPVRDWFRDYLIPAATKGPYRRNLVVVEETRETFPLHPTKQEWGEWDTLVSDFELKPAGIESVIDFARRKGCSQEEAKFVFVRGLGYPEETVRTAEELTQHAVSRQSIANAKERIESLPKDARERLAICSLPNSIFTDEIDAILGRGRSTEILQWLSSLPGSIAPEQTGNCFQLDDSVRLAAINSIEESPRFREAEQRWLPYARLVRNVPSHADRARLYQLSGLEWIDGDKRETLFKEKAEDISNLINERDCYFSTRKRFTHVSGILIQDLYITAKNIDHQGAREIYQRAAGFWETRETCLRDNLQDLSKSLMAVQERFHVIQARCKQVSGLIKRFQKNGTPIPNEPDPELVGGKNGLYISLLMFLAIGATASGLSLEMPNSALAFVVSGAASIFSLALVPGWKLQAAAKRSHKRAQIKNSPEYLKRENNELILRMQKNQTAYDHLQREISMAKEELEYNYV
ncbi:MAG: hypothetical protein VYC82_06170 [Verrucomicrobiota bacterium]|nr:hypothetical protein [Verrucomicrobiota bacterium]